MTPGGVFDPEQLRQEIHELEQLSGDPTLWDDRAAAERTMTRLNQLRTRLDPWESLVHKIEELEELLELGIEEGDQEVAREVEQGLSEARKTLEELQLRELFQDEIDYADAYLTVHAGAGGTEACDWANMLLRMYLRWCESVGYKTRTLDLQESEGGIKSVTLEVSGELAFGYLRAESGIHRLVRISPFDSGGRRHTSFASVYVSPVITDEIEVEIKPDEIRVDTYRASGAGGQHVNKTDSAVRITHFESGIVVQCQNERSQHKNREIAMKILRSRLYEHYRAEREREQEKNALEKKEIGWGNQIRSYVFQPYTMVKDHRKKHETGNIQAVMDGEIGEFIEAYLHAGITADSPSASS